MSTHLVIPDPHAHPDHNNNRADYIGRLIVDLRPSVVINIGDQFDMDSLNSYDKGKRDFHTKTYASDIEAGLDFSERLFAPIRGLKKKQPRKVFLIGNHEQRIERALDLSPELVGTLSYTDLDLKRDYNEIVEYTGGTPGTIEIDGILYAHYITSGVKGFPIGGIHAAHTLIGNTFQSTTVGHTHTFDYRQISNGQGKTIHGLVAGCMVDFAPKWAGQELYKKWMPGVAICRDVYKGQYDLQWISMAALEKEYGNG